MTLFVVCFLCFFNVSSVIQNAVMFAKDKLSFAGNPFEVIFAVESFPSQTTKKSDSILNIFTTLERLLSS